MFLTVVAAFGGLLFGYDTAVISGTVKYLGINFVDPRVLSETAANSLLGFVVSSALIGCVLGGLIGGYLSSYLGRKRSLMVAAILFVVSAVGSAFPEIFCPPGETYTFLPNFIVYRILGGIGVGLVSMLSPMYIAEIAPADMRGRLVSFNQLAIITGMLLVYFVNYSIARGSAEQWITDTGWRMMFLSAGIPAVLLLILLFFVPESPRWLIMNGHEQKAVSIISRITGGVGVQDEVRSVRASMLQGTVRVKLFTYGVGIIVIGILLSIFQQFVGINVVMYYAPEIFRNMGMETSGALAQTIVVGIINMIATVIAISTVDRFGRRPLMIVGSLGMSMSMLVLGSLFYFCNVGVSALVAMLFYVASFSLSWGPVCWVLLSEIFPNTIRAQAMSVAVAVQWMANYLVSWTFPIMDKSTALNNAFHGGFAYWIYALMGVLSALFIWKCIPETKGKSLEEIGRLFKY